jgi:catechol 2,3-dioxygenase-like lactoylglutathione lyase family enzyme
MVADDTVWSMGISASRVFHVNVNCSDLDRSVAFYRDRLGLVPSARTRPLAPQPGRAFALEQAQWDAFMMTAGHGGPGPVVDLLEWKVPPPTGRPHESTVALGFSRLLVSSPGADTSGVLTDPDGTLVQIDPGERTGVAGVVIGCSDLDRTTAFFTQVVGFEPDETGPGRIAVAGAARGKAARLRDRVGRFAVELVEWRRPVSIPAPYPVANHLGMYRMALMTDDIDADYDELRAHGVRCVSAPTDLDMGPGLPTLRALLFADPDGTVLELIETPDLQA